jgi:hypothetical protein
MRARKYEADLFITIRQLLAGEINRNEFMALKFSREFSEDMENAKSIQMN